MHEVKTEVCCLNLLNCWPETALPVAKYPIASLCLTDRWFQTATPQNWPKQGSLCLLNLPERQLFVVPALAKPQNLTPVTSKALGHAAHLSASTRHRPRTEDGQMFGRRDGRNEMSNDVRTRFCHTRGRLCSHTQIPKPPTSLGHSPSTRHSYLRI